MSQKENFEGFFGNAFTALKLRVDGWEGFTSTGSLYDFSDE
jgi:hypothetical protein